MSGKNGATTQRVLLVDDEPKVLAGLRRQLRKTFRVDTAEGPEEGMRAVRESGPYAVIVSDMRMPGMNGVDFLRAAQALSPDSVRMMLTGNSDQKTAAAAVNEGRVFRFLTKPCDAERMAAALAAALEQHRLITAERELLEKTLRGSVKVLTDVLALVNPTAFGRAARVRRMAKAVAGRCGVARTWTIELAAMLSQLGCVSVPEDTLRRVYAGDMLTDEEERMVAEHPEVARSLIAHIPRLEPVAEMVALQGARFDGGRAGATLPLGARILKVALDYDALIAGGRDAEDALAEMRGAAGAYDPALLEHVGEIVGATSKRKIERVSAAMLAPPMILAEDVCTVAGTVLVTRGQEVTESLRRRLVNFVAGGLVAGSIAVTLPA